MPDIQPHLRFPHEDIEAFRRQGEAGGVGMLGYEAVQLARLVGYKVRAESTRSITGNFAVINGSLGADVLPHKYDFGEFVQNLGYSAPSSVLVNPGDELQDLRGRVAALDEQNPQRFCKPVGGNRGRGTSLQESTVSAVAFALSQKRPYLVQTVERPIQDWRYILHRDVTQAATGAPPGWRVAYEKVRPSVFGDGERTIGQLVEARPDIPLYAKQKYFKHHKNALAHIPDENETVELIQSGNIAQGAYGRMPTEHEKHTLDTFMDRFRRDVEQSLGITLGTACVDLGIKDPGILSEQYDFDRLRKGIVFYEHQLPFGMSGYTNNLPDEVSWGSVDRLMPREARRRYVGLQIYACLMRSSILSGIALQKINRP